MSTKFIFVRDNNNFPVGCFAYNILEYEGGLEYGYSIYFFGKDTFSKARGRYVAQGRLNSTPRILSESLPQQELVVKMLRKVVATGTHQWAFDKKPGYDGKPVRVSRPLGHRFMGACERTAKKLVSAMKRDKEVAA